MHPFAKPTRVKKKSRPLPLPAGGFSSWLRRLRKALIRETGIRVNCGACRACCASSYFIHIGPEEKQTLARIPKEFLVQAPGLPKGYWLLGHLKNGRCPMWVQARCSIYADRPLACRQYDCRIFTAAGITAGGHGQRLINRRVRRWKFSVSTPGDRIRRRAVQAAAGFIQDRMGGAGAGPGHAIRTAMLAVKVYPIFFKSRDESGGTAKRARALASAAEKFDARRKKTPAHRMRRTRQNSGPDGD